MLYLGCLRAGAVYLPLNTAYTAGEIRYFLGDAEPALFVCRPELEGQMAELGRELGVPHVADAWASRATAACGPGSRPRWRPDVDVPRGRGRPRGLPLHLRHHRPLQGCDAQPRQPRLERGDAARCLAVHRRRPAAARAADLPHPRPVRRHQHHADGRRLADLPAALRPRRDDAPAAEGDHDDGRADLLHAPAVAARLHPRAGGAHAPVRLGLGAALGRDAQGVQGAHRPRHPRALRHDRDQHEHLEPLRRRAHPGQRRPAAAGRGDPHHRPGDRRACCRRARSA